MRTPSLLQILLILTVIRAVMLRSHTVVTQPDGPELGTPIPSERCGDIAMRLDPDIKRDVEDELRSDPDNIEVRPQVPSIEIKRKLRRRCGEPLRSTPAALRSRRMEARSP